MIYKRTSFVGNVISCSKVTRIDAIQKLTSCMKKRIRYFYFFFFFEDVISKVLIFVSALGTT